MRLFRRKPTNELEAERCPYCREPLPDDATKCMMCGASLPQAALEDVTQLAEAERPQR
jgi:predicted amidophosphoribosyltransferase